MGLSTDYCPQCCVTHVTCECPYEGETEKQYWTRMARLQKSIDRDRDTANHIDGYDRDDLGESPDF